MKAAVSSQPPAVRIKKPVRHVGLVRQVGHKSPRLRVSASPRPFWLLINITLLFLICITPVLAKDDGARVVVVVANYLSLDDLMMAGPNICKMISKSGIGLMNTGVGRSTTPEVQYLSIGAGARVSGTGDAAACYNSYERIGQESAGDIYTRQMGRNKPPSSIVCLGLARILRANQQMPFNEEAIGFLGDAFHNANLRTAVIGNADVPDGRIRRAPFIAMDRWGIMDSGEIGTDVTKVDIASPCGIADNLEVITSLVRRYMADHSLVVVELGDLSRIESVREQLSDAAYILHRQRGKRNLDGLIKSIRPEIERRGAILVLLSPCRVNEPGKFWSNLAPVVVYKPGGSIGLLASTTTRTEGLISNIDVAPTILRAARLEVPGFVVGQAAEIIIKKPDVIDEHLKRMEQTAARNYALRVPVLAGVGALVILAVTLTEIILYRGGSRVRVRRALKLILMIAFSITTAMLVADSIDSFGLGIYLSNLIAAVVAILIIAYGVAAVISRWRECSPLVILNIMMAALIIGDILTGANLLRWSILACNQIPGIRYYGLGNEYMGLLVASSLLAPILLIRTHRLSAPGTLDPWIPGSLALWFAFVMWVIGYPGLGANAGGLIMATAAFGTALILMLGIKFRPGHALMLAAAAGIVVALFAFIDALSHGAHGSHLGRSVSLAHAYGWEYIRSLLTRKIMMHIGILKLRQTYLPILFSIPFLLMYQRRMKAEGTRRDILWSVGMPAMIAGMTAGFLFNDSGIVPAGLMLAAFMVSDLYLRLGEDKK